jgi:nicotinamide-nucleotide amidase
MHAIILSVGDELASGLTTNTNSAYLAQQLTALGIPTVAHLTVGDDLQAIVTAVRAACDQLDLDSPPASPGGEPPAAHPAGLLLISGGLGPTDDDLTRQALADALTQSLVEDPDAMLQIQRWFESKGRVMSPSNRLQALRPHGATVLENFAGTAPGIRAARNGVEIFVMPGVPREMKEMFTRSVLPAVQQAVARHAPDPAVTLVSKVNTFGLGESVLGERIKDLMVRGGVDTPEGAHVTVGTTVHDGIVSVRIYATGARAAAAAATDRLKAAVADRLGPLVFGHDDDALETAVATLLLQRKNTVATAESCTGGMLATYLTNTPGSSACFLRGWVTYANAAKHDDLSIPNEMLAAHGAVSEPVARTMAENARKFAHADFALATTGVAGPDGGSPEKPVGTVWIALATPAGTDARQFIMPGHRHAVRTRTCQMALALLRWKLLGVPPPV